MAAVEDVYRAESRSVFATLIRLLGDFDRAEEALQDAFAAAVEQWPRTGMPANPRAWLISVGRFKSIDALRRRVRHDESLTELLHQLQSSAANAEPAESESVEDDRLRLIFTCCHPALSSDARVALTLREVCGLTTEQIARAFLTNVPVIAKRIVRAKAKIRDARIPYEVPSRAELADRLDHVLQVVYLVFTEGYAATSGEALTRCDLSSEAIYLGRTLLEILPEPEVQGLLALMLLQDSRRAARTSPASGDLILLEEQDRSLWNRAFIEEGGKLVESALTSRRFGPYTLQAAIAAVHAEAAFVESRTTGSASSVPATVSGSPSRSLFAFVEPRTTGSASSVPATVSGSPSRSLFAAKAYATDWAQIVGLYDVLLRCAPSPVIELNRAVAVAMRDTPEAGLRLIDAILSRGDLEDYYLAHSARADLLRRLGKFEEARISYERALGLTQLEPARRFLQKRLAEL